MGVDIKKSCDEIRQILTGITSGLANHPLPYQSVVMVSGGLAQIAQLSDAIAAEAKEASVEKGKPKDAKATKTVGAIEE